MVQYIAFKLMDVLDAQKVSLLKEMVSANPAQITLTTYLPTIHVSHVTKTQCIIKQQRLANVQKGFIIIKHSNHALLVETVSYIIKRQRNVKAVPNQKCLFVTVLVILVLITLSMMLVLKHV